MNPTDISDPSMDELLLQGSYQYPNSIGYCTYLLSLPINDNEAESNAMLQDPDDVVSQVIDGQIRL